MVISMLFLKITVTSAYEVEPRNLHGIPRASTESANADNSSFDNRHRKKRQAIDNNIGSTLSNHNTPNNTFQYSSTTTRLPVYWNIATYFGNISFNEWHRRMHNHLGRFNEYNATNFTSFVEGLVFAQRLFCPEIKMCVDSREFRGQVRYVSLFLDFVEGIISHLES